MKLDIHGKHLVVTEALKGYAQEEISRLGKWFDREIEAHATLSVRGHQHLHRVEITLLAGCVTIRAEEKSKDIYASIDLAVEKLEAQARRYKEKLKRHYRESGGLKHAAHGTSYTFEEDDYFISRQKNLQLKPVDLDEAILEMNLLDHAFHVFLNKQTNRTDVIYRRSDGSYGLLQT